MSSERRYTEEEMRAVFERAARRQRAVRNAAAAAEGGLSLEELQRIGAASGIDPEHVAAAAAEVDLAHDPPGQALFGAPVEVEQTRVLPGAVSEAGWARMVAEVRRAFGEDGAAGQVGPVREWTAVGRGLRRDLATRLSVEPEGDRTRVILRQSTREVARLLTLSGALMAAVGTLFLALATFGVDPAEMWPAVALSYALAAAMVGGTHVGMRLWARRQERKFDAVLDRLELVARSAAPRGARQEGDALGAARLEAPATARPPALDLDEPIGLDEPAEQRGLGARPRGRERTGS